MAAGLEFVGRMTGCTHLDYRKNLYMMKELNTQTVTEFGKNYG
jgi:hypothetical protein